MYKDKDKQREADRERQRRYRAERGKQAYPKGVTDLRRDKAKGVTNAGRDGQGVTPNLGQAGTPDLGQVGTSKPGDVFEKTVYAGLKRGKDIKCFEDLPADVQGVIHKLSTIDGKIDQTSKANRTAIAVNYQHQFPDRYHSTGVV